MIVKMFLDWFGGIFFGYHSTDETKRWNSQGD